MGLFGHMDMKEEVDLRAKLFTEKMIDIALLFSFPPQ